MIQLLRDARDVCRAVAAAFTQVSALDASVGMMRKGAAKCDTHAE